MAVRVGGAGDGLVDDVGGEGVEGPQLIELDHGSGVLRTGVLRDCSATYEG